jgi:hypothetical protein
MSKKKKSSPTIPTQTPVVEFEYPDSDTNRMKVRYVRVIQADADYVKGYELENPFSTKEGKFKQYCRTRIARNGVALVRF